MGLFHRISPISGRSKQNNIPSVTNYYIFIELLQPSFAFGAKTEHISGILTLVQTEKI